KGIGAFAGATIMGDGAVALILDVLGLAQRAHVVSAVRERALNEKSTSEVRSAVERHTLLVFATPDGGRMAIPLSQVARLEEFPRPALERVGPTRAVQYRDEILPLIHVSRALRAQGRASRNGRRAARPARTSSPKAETAGDTVSVVVYANKGQRVGL